jgi:hypothetical protein
MRKAVLLLVNCILVLLPGISGGAERFDGAWSTKLTCPAKGNTEGNVVHFSVAGDGEIIQNLGTIRGARQLELYNGVARVRVRLHGTHAHVAASAAGVTSGFRTI